MILENLVFDAVDPHRLGRFWQDLLEGRTLSDDPRGFETRLQWPAGPLLDLCFQPVDRPARTDQRVLPRLRAMTGSGQDTARLAVHLGARKLAQQPGGARLFRDPEGNLFQVSDEPRAAGAGGTLAGISVASADPARDVAFWRWLTGWQPAGRSASAVLRHPSRQGPFLELSIESAAKGAGKNAIHLDVRASRGQELEALARQVVEHGARELHTTWGRLPWRVFLDPSGNEFCVLPAAHADS